MNREDREQFERLIRSQIRSPERAEALRVWETYKIERQVSEANERGRKAGLPLGKGGYIRALTMPVIDLTGATLKDVCLGYADLRGVRLDNAVFEHLEASWTALKGSNLEAASLKHVNLSRSCLIECDLRRADLTGADLHEADLSGANLTGAILRDCNLAGANLSNATLVSANVGGAVLDDARVYGVSAWDLRGQPKSSKDLVLTPETSPTINVDDIQVAQFVYLLLDNPRIRDVLDTVTRRVVLLLGRFSPERKAVLDSLREALRRENYVPVLFDFQAPADIDITETVTLLARMARFVVADLTDPASIPHELQAIAPDVAVPIRLVVAEGHKPYAMSRDLRKYHWVIKPFRYSSPEHLLARLRPDVIEVAEAKRVELAEERGDGDW